MRRAARQFLRFLGLAAVVSLLSITIAPLPDGGSPYVSALSDLTGVSAIADPCPKDRCEFVSGQRPMCVNTSNHTFCQGPISECQTVAC